MVRLTDEQIRKLYNDWLHSNQTLPEFMFLCCGAQLRAVVEDLRNEAEVELIHWHGKRAVILTQKADEYEAELKGGN